MNTFLQILAIAAAGLLIWLLIRVIKRDKGMFTKENISKSFSTMGFLALILIAFIAFCVLLLRTS